MPDLLDRQGILDALRELTVELGPGPVQHVVVVAGFLMELVSLRVRDAHDLPALWPHAGFDTAEGAVEVLYTQAYPAEPPDEHLSGFLRAKLGLPP